MFVWYREKVRSGILVLSMTCVRWGWVIVSSVSLFVAVILVLYCAVFLSSFSSSSSVSGSVSSGSFASVVRSSSVSPWLSSSAPSDPSVSVSLSPVGVMVCLFVLSGSPIAVVRVGV